MNCFHTPFSDTKFLYIPKDRELRALQSWGLSFSNRFPLSAQHFKDEHLLNYSTAISYFLLIYIDYCKPFLIKADAKSKLFNTNRQRNLCSMLLLPFRDSGCCCSGEKGLELTPVGIFECTLDNHFFKAQTCSVKDLLLCHQIQNLILNKMV